MVAPYSREGLSANSVVVSHASVPRTTLFSGARSGGTAPRGGSRKGEAEGGEISKLSSFTLLTYL